jgi:DinB superfamily
MRTGLAAIRTSPAPPSIGWLTRHVIWWWSGTLSAIRGDTPQDAGSVCWPGSADEAVAVVRWLADEWSRVLDALDDASLVRPVAYPWSEPRPLSYAVCWVNLELMKNAAEIGEVANMFDHRALLTAPPSNAADIG